MAPSIYCSYSILQQIVGESVHIYFTENFIRNPFICNFKNVRLFVADDFEILIVQGFKALRRVGLIPVCGF